MDVPNHRVVRFEAMGSPCAVHIDGLFEQGEWCAAEAIREVRRIEAKYSRYLPASFLSEINRSALVGGEIALDDETSALIDYAAQSYRVSEGLFDITSGLLRKVWDFQAPAAAPDPTALEGLLPLVGFDKLRWSAPLLAFTRAGMEIDLGGLAKEYAADRAVEVCCAHGASYCLVDLGGDISAGGPRFGGLPWPVSIRGSAAAEEPVATIDLTRGAVASSGDYERFIEIGGRRYSHILNPRTGWPVTGLAAVSIAADRCLTAGTISTIAMLKGQNGADWLASGKAAYMWVDHEGKRAATPPFVLR